MGVKIDWFGPASHFENGGKIFWENFMKSFHEMVNAFLMEGLRIVHDDFVGAIPDLIGYSGIVAGACMMVCPMINKSMMKPFGIFSVVSIMGLSVMGAF